MTRPPPASGSATTKPAPRDTTPVTVGWEADDHKAYYPGSHRITMRFTGDRATGRLLGVQLLGHKHAEVAKRVDIAATAIFHSMTIDAISDLDLSCTPPLGSPWDAVQAGAQAWTARPVPGIGRKPPGRRDFEANTKQRKSGSGNRPARG